MIKLCLDENINHQFARSLKAVFRRVTFVTVRQLGHNGLEDLALFQALGNDGVEGLITLDQRQLVDNEERAGLREAGLHWIGMKMPDGKGYAFNAAVHAALMNGIKVLLDEGLESKPHQYLFAGAKKPGKGTITKTVI